MNDQFAPNNANGAAGTPVDALLAQIRDLTTTAAQLQQIAAHAPQHPELIAPLLAHPNTYPQLAQWLRGLQPQNDPSAARYTGPAVSGIGASAATTIGLATSQASGTGTAAGTDLAGAPGATATPAASQVSGVAPASAPGAPVSPADPSAISQTFTPAAHVDPAATSQAFGGIPPVNTAGSAAQASAAAGRAGATVGAKAGGLSAGKVIAGLVAVVLVAGGGTAGYLALNDGLPWGGETSGDAATSAPVEPSETGPTAASLSDDELLALLKTAPAGQLERDYISSIASALGGSATAPSSYTGSVLSASFNGSTVRVVNDGTLITESEFPDLSSYQAKRSQQPAIRDVDGDGVRDIVTIVTNPVPEAGVSSNGSADGFSAFTVYTPTDDGSALTVRAQLAVYDEATSIYDLQASADAALDEAYLAAGGSHTASSVSGSGYTALSLSEDGSEFTVRRTNYWGPDGDTDPDQGTDLVTYRIGFESDAITLDDATIEPIRAMAWS